MSNVTQTSDAPITTALSVVRVKWDDDTDFAKGVHTVTETIGSGIDAVVKSEANADTDDNIPYNDVANYTLSDGAKITVDDGGSEKASLKNLGGDSKAYPFSTSGNYTFDSSQIEFTGTEAGLAFFNLADSTIAANYITDLDANYGDGVLTGTSGGAGPSVSGGFLDLAQDDIRFVKYASADNFVSAGSGCIRLKIKPNYSGTPSTTQILMDVNNEVNNSNRVVIWHDTDGEIYTRLSTLAGVKIYADETWGVWSPTAGVEYEIEWNWSMGIGASRIFIDGTQFGSTKTDSAIHGIAGLITIHVGTNFSEVQSANFYVDSFVIFDVVKHTSNYTPDVVEPGTYSVLDPTIESNTGLAFSVALDEFTETSTKPGSNEIKYQMSSDDGTTYKWWTGSAWVQRTDTTTEIVPSAISTVTGTLDAGNLASIQTLDASTYDVSEVTGTPGFLIEVTFTNVPAAPTQITSHDHYSALGGHTVNFDIWNYETLAWDNIGTVPQEVGIVQHDFTVTGTETDYLSGSGEVKIRYNHTSSGIPTHDIFIDYIYLLLDEDPPDSFWYDNETNLASVVETNIGTLAVSGTVKFIAFLHSDTGLDTPLLDNIVVGNVTTYSTTDDLYIDTKAASQIVPVELVQWLTTTITNNIPANTDIKLLFSVDNRVNWLTWSGSAWVAPVSPTARANATSITDAQTNFSTLALGSNTLDVRLFLFTSDSSVTADVDNINVIADGGFDSPGFFESNIYDSEELSKDWNTVGFNIEILSGTTLTFKARASNDSGSMGSYGSGLSNGEDADITGRFFQWKCDFTTTGLNSAEVDYFFVEYALFFSSEVEP